MHLKWKWTCEKIVYVLNLIERQYYEHRYMHTFIFALVPDFAYSEMQL